MRKTKFPQEITIDIDTKIFNDKYLPYLQSIHEYEVYYGGQGSGKSWFICQKKILQLTQQENRNMICLRKQSTDCFDSCWGQMITAIDQLELSPFWNINRSDHVLRNVINGNSIYFDGVDKIENIKSFKPEKGNLTDVWYEEVSEEESRKNIRDIDGRLRDQHQKCSLILSFNPTYRQHWLFEFVNVFCRDKDAIIVHSTYKDNKYLNDAYRQKTEALKYDDPYGYQVYCLGEWGITGQSAFNANKIATRMKELNVSHKNAPPQHGIFAYETDDSDRVLPGTFRFLDTGSGEVTIYREPNKKHPYVLGVDTAGEGVDFYAGQVIDNITGEQVAVFHSIETPDVCALQVFGLGMHYNEALIVPEINFDGAFLLHRLRELGYNKIYRRSGSPDEMREGALERKYGYRTTAGNRMLMLTMFKDWTESHMHCINDVPTLNEMLTFTRQPKKLKGVYWGAEAGAHDDLVLSFALALQGREQQDCREVAERKKLEGDIYPETLLQMIKDGACTYQEAREYMKGRRFMGEKYKLPAGKRGKKYDRDH